MSEPSKAKTLFVTGGLGFIGSNFIQYWLSRHDDSHRVVVLDAMTYACNPITVQRLSADARLHVVKGTIGKQTLVETIFDTYRPTAVINFAAETHVDRSIDDMSPFIETNVVDLAALLTEVKRYWQRYSKELPEFRFVQVSTDEVFGSRYTLPPAESRDIYHTGSPYSASKAAGDHLADAFFKTYGLPTIVTHGANTYGPYQFPEKLIPMAICNGLENKKIPVYGSGLQRREWLHVYDHCTALQLLLEKGVPGTHYNIGAQYNRTNYSLLNDICKLLDRRDWFGTPHKNLLTFVEDRPGHDFEYSMNSAAMYELGWNNSIPHGIGLITTLEWYADNKDWVKAARQQYDGRRLGLSTST